MHNIHKALRLLKAQFGLPYVFGVEVAFTDPTPEAFDCSELVEWLDHRVGPGKMPDGSMNQREYCRREGTMIPLARALRTPGALVFRDVSVLGVGHVAVVTDPTHTGEARGSVYGVGKFLSDPVVRLWTEGALWPGFDYTKKAEPALVDRWVVTGPYGVRWGGFQGHADLPDDEAQRLAKIIRRFRRRFPDRPALTMFRKEPKDIADLADEDDYVTWLASKRNGG